MPDKTPAPKPKYKVEEVVDDESISSDTKTKREELRAHEAEHEHKRETSESETVTPQPEKEETPPSTQSELPKVTSFSLVDHPKEEESELHEEAREDPIAPETEPGESSPESEVSSNEIQEWLQSVRPDTSQVPPRAGGGMGKFLALFLTLLIIAALGGGVYYYRSNVEGNPLTQNETSKTEEKVETTPAAQTPTPTIPQVDLSSLKVQILNGSGVAGEAGKAQSYLEKPGFKSFKTGNASSFNFTDTTVALKANTPEEVFTEAQKALSDYYQNVVKADKPLPESSEFDIVVTIGKKK